MQKDFWKDKRVCVTGGDGFLGKHLVDKLKKKKAAIFVPKIGEYDLREMCNCMKVTKNQEIVIHLAGVLGGTEFNKEQPGKIYFDNVLMNTNMIEAARLNGVKKFVGISSTSAYPSGAKIPLKEESLFDGPPEAAKESYSYSKRMLVVQAKAYRQQYHLNAITLILSNLYGPGDNFDEKKAHVIPSLIAKHFKYSTLSVSGNPESSRNFLYVDDAADAIILAAENYNSPEPVNISHAEEVKIKELVNIISEYTGFKGKVIWSGSTSVCSRKPVDTAKAKTVLSFEAKTSIREGIQKTIEGYRKKPISNL